MKSVMDSVCEYLSGCPLLDPKLPVYFVIFSLLFSISETVIGMMITRSSAPVASCAAVISAESVDRIVLAAGV